MSLQRDRSTANTVVLSDVTPASSGNYKCEVSAEAPSFHTDSGSGKLLVVGKVLCKYIVLYITKNRMLLIIIVFKRLNTC